MTIQSGNQSQQFISGLSTDTKPVGPNLQNATFYETDTGKYYQYLNNVWVVFSTRTTLVDAAGNGINLIASPGGYQLPVTPVPTLAMMDNFNGTVIDVTNRWSAPVLAGTGTVTQASGNLICTTGTTASNSGAINTIESFESTIGALSVGALVQTEASPSTNTHRCFGFYTRPGSFTAATPVQDGYVWELDITGAWRASVYNGGTRVSSTVVALSGSTFVPIQVAFSGLTANFFYGNFVTPAVSIPFVQPSTLNLPFGFHCINHTSPPAQAPTWSSYGIAVVDAAGVIDTSWNGQTSFRARSPTVFKSFNATSIAAETTIWTPATGKKFRLMGWNLTSGTVGGNVVLKDNTAGATIGVIPFGAAASNNISHYVGNGIPSATANNVLTATGTATQTLSGMIWGTEE
jgi:hypothetical protein